MGRSFAVSGFGRSGSKWLADVLHRSPTWTVEHEPGGPYTNVDVTRARFDVGRAAGPYGEVNSYLLPSLFDVGASPVGVLLRCPRQITVSCIRRGYTLNENFITYLDHCLACVDAAADRGALVISFSRMVTDALYATEVADKLGVKDVTVTAADLTTKVNASVGRMTWAKMDHHARDAVTFKVDWFTRKYEHLLDTVSA